MGNRHTVIMTRGYKGAVENVTVESRDPFGVLFERILDHNGGGIDERLKHWTDESGIAYETLRNYDARGEVAFERTWDMGCQRCGR